MKRKTYIAQCGMTGRILKRYSFNSAAKACGELLNDWANGAGLPGTWIKTESTLEKNDDGVACHGVRAWKHATSGKGYRAVINLMGDFL